MHVCMCACVHVCMCACVHVCTCARVHVCTCARVHVCTCACMHACMYVCMDVCMHGCMDAWMHVCMYACMCVCINLDSTWDIEMDVYSVGRKCGKQYAKCALTRYNVLQIAWKMHVKKHTRSCKNLCSLQIACKPQYVVLLNVHFQCHPMSFAVIMLYLSACILHLWCCFWRWWYWKGGRGRKGERGSQIREYINTCIMQIQAIHLRT